MLVIENGLCNTYGCVATFWLCIEKPSRCYVVMFHLNHCTKFVPLVGVVEFRRGVHSDGE